MMTCLSSPPIRTLTHRRKTSLGMNNSRTILCNTIPCHMGLFTCSSTRSLMSTRSGIIKVARSSQSGNSSSSSSKGGYQPTATHTSQKQQGPTSISRPATNSTHARATSRRLGPPGRTSTSRGNNFSKVPRSKNQHPSTCCSVRPTCGLRQTGCLADRPAPRGRTRRKNSPGSFWILHGLRRTKMTLTWTPLANFHPHLTHVASERILRPATTAASAAGLTAAESTAYNKQQQQQQLRQQ
mmetsp:Transcript_12627/g.38005  ORF Transcript_12627/g.38005 Transcript_12627/m.38005 type:complete len:240 (-) Transcript_12627:747-1466(-)